VAEELGISTEELELRSLIEDERSDTEES